MSELAVATDIDIYVHTDIRLRLSYANYPNSENALLSFFRLLVVWHKAFGGKNATCYRPSRAAGFPCLQLES